MLGEQSQSEFSYGVPTGIFHRFQCSAARMGILVKLLILFGGLGVIAENDFARNRSAWRRAAWYPRTPFGASFGPASLPRDDYAAEGKLCPESLGAS